MSYRSIFDAKTPSQICSVSFDFTGDFTAAETLSTYAVTAVVYSGNDPAPSSIFSGAATVSGKVVGRTVGASVSGVTYLLTATATSNLGTTRSQQGYLTTT